MNRSEEPVIACTLTGEEMAARREEMEALARDNLIGREREELRVRLRYRRTPAVEAAVRDLVRRESVCCAFLAFALESEGEDLTLEIRGPRGSEEVLAAIYQASVSAP